jgi:hypothetical protein
LPTATDTTRTANPFCVADTAKKKHRYTTSFAQGVGTQQEATTKIDMTWQSAKPAYLTLNVSADSLEASKNLTDTTKQPDTPLAIVHSPNTNRRTMPSNLPPGVTDEMVDRAAGTDTRCECGHLESEHTDIDATDDPQALLNALREIDAEFPLLDHKGKIRDALDKVLTSCQARYCTCRGFTQ